ncbi:hypothetical protein BKA93DRAFT_829545 [Sparassis latifolia]|uniref:CS domain-containing protein n=1 Tax=Sparassis crispa TaxID=139825 RepID=A0A401H072_9APHY|nr:hypothetical protein SCP_1200360 [Sparassis crispa]GBE87811.1 hypothetical protein SCP_1200360 [Sparassis crispa]
MDRIHEFYQSYSWHQSHDQATVLLLVPYETVEEEVTVAIERNHLVAGVRGQAPIVKGRLYGTVDTANSDWQLEPRASPRSTRERATSTTSAGSNQSSYAYVSDPDFSSSFAASLENGLASELDDPVSSSPALSSPISSMDENSFAMLNHRRSHGASRPISPPSAPPFSLTSSYSSMESLHTASGRLLTIHIEKAESMIWPSLVVGPVPETLSPSMLGAYPWASASTLTAESKYNMDPTSLVLLALDLYDIRKAYEEAFEYFVRAWHQAHVPSATIRLATHYLPLQSVFPDLVPSPSSHAPPLESVELTEVPAISPSTVEPSTPKQVPPSMPPTPGTPAYYLDRLGGGPGLAQLFLAAGLLHLEGAAAPLLSSAYAGLSSLRAPAHTSSSISGAAISASHHTHGSSTDAWRRDRAAARCYFERARALAPALDVPLLPPDADSDSSGKESGSGDRDRERGRRGTILGPGARQQLEMPSIEVHRAPPTPAEQQTRRRRKKGSGDLSSAIMEGVRDADADDDDRTWYLYIPGLVGAGTALLVVGFLSFSSWRKSQGS